MNQKPRDDDHQQVDHPIHREAVRIIINRGCTHESVGKGECVVRVKRRGEDRGRGVDGEGDGGGGDNVAD